MLIDARLTRLVPLLLLAIVGCSDLEPDDGDHGVAIEDTTLTPGALADTAVLPEAPAVLEEQATP